MELWIWVVVGGLAGIVLMDITAITAEKLNITRGGDVEDLKPLGVGHSDYSMRVLYMKISSTLVL